MQPLFECRFADDKEWAKDIYGLIHLRRPLLWVADAVLLVCFLFGIYTAVVWQYVDYLLLIGAPMMVSVRFVLYGIQTKLVIKRQVEMYGKTVENVWTVTDDEMTASMSSGAEYHVHYADVKRAVQTKKFVYLWSKTRTVYSFKKDGFTVGTADEFIEFLKSKGIRVK